MYFLLVVILLGIGVALSWLGASRASAPKSMERTSGALLVAALALLGAGLSATHRVAHGQEDLHGIEGAARASRLPAPPLAAAAQGR